MSYEMPKCKVTVLKRTLHQDLIAEYLDTHHPDAHHQGTGPCECFQDGEEFIIDPAGMPEEFTARCPWAWADIRQDILTVAYGGDMPGMKQRGTLITGCTDWLRPVIFKVERMEMKNGIQ